jgi:hypothetical protein
LHGRRDEFVKHFAQGRHAMLREPEGDPSHSWQNGKLIPHSFHFADWRGACRRTGKQKDIHDSIIAIAD